MTDHSEKLVKNTILYLPAQFLTPAAQFATTVIWTYLLSPEAFGVVAFVIASQEAAAWAAVTWWSLFMMRFRRRYAALGEGRFQDMDRRVISASVVALFVLTAPILALIGQASDAPLFLAAASYFVLRSLLIHYSEWARAEHKIAAYSIAQLMSALLGSGLSIAAILLLGPSPAVAIAAQAVGQLAAIVALCVQTGLRPGLGAFDRQIFADALRYCGPLVVSGVSGWAAPNCIRILVQYWGGAESLGLLSVGWGLGQRIAAVLAMLFTAAAYPLAVSHIESGDRRGALGQVSLNGVFLLAILAPATVGAALLSEPLVELMIAEPFREMTVVVLPIAILAASIRSLRVHVSDQATLLVEQTTFTLYVCVFEALASILFCAVGLYVDGVVGAAIGVVAGTTLSTIVSFAFTIGVLGLPAPAPGTLLRILLATGIMGEALMLTPAPVGAMAVTAKIIFGAALYATLIFATFPECRAFAGRRLRQA